EKVFLVTADPAWQQQIVGIRQAFLEDLAKLGKAARSESTRAVTQRLGDALEDDCQVFYPLKTKAEPTDHDQRGAPPELRTCLERLAEQSEVAYDAVKTSMKDQVAAAKEKGEKAERVTWIAGLFSFLLGIIVFAFLVRSINDPLRRLTHGTRAIAKGQFWHRLPAHGSDEFAELARDFNSMTQRLAELDQMKKDFVSHVSHDLKAPLASIRQIMHLLLQEIPGPLNEQQQGLIRLSYNSAERLAAMVGNLLDISRMEAGSMEYQMAANDIVSL